MKNAHRKAVLVLFMILAGSGILIAQSDLGTIWHWNKAPAGVL